MNKGSPPELSLIIPLYNEVESVNELHAELLKVLVPLGRSFEIIFVNDGSTDGTLERIKTLTPLRLISFTRNFGKSQALRAGFQAAHGEYIFTLDGDLQDDPREIERFLTQMEKDQADVVCGWKKRRQDDVLKRLVSKVANGLTRLFTGTSIHDMNCCFKLYRREAAKALNLYGDMHRYIPALAAAQGFRLSELVINHRERKFGVSKYGNFRRFSKSFFDFITLLLIRHFIDRPMHFFGIIGSLSSLLGILILIHLAYIKLVHQALIGNRPLLLLGVLLVVVGIQLFSSGFLGELIIRQNSSGRIYTVREDSNQ